MSKNARAKRAKPLFFIVKYCKLVGFCCRRRRGCLSSLLCGPRKQLSTEIFPSYLRAGHTNVFPGELEHISLEATWNNQEVITEVRS